MTFLEGKKTYILTILGVIYVLSAYFTGHMDLNSAIQTLELSLGLSTVKASIVSATKVKN